LKKKRVKKPQKYLQAKKKVVLLQCQRKTGNTLIGEGHNDCPFFLSVMIQ
jgi:hypothetical protein